MSTLFTITTNELTLTWSQRRKKKPPVEPGKVSSVVSVQGLRQGVEPELHVRDDGVILFEQVNYSLFIKSRTEATVQVRHRDPVLVQSLQQADGGRVLHGTINFGSQVGLSRFVVEVDGIPHIALEVEVFPSKLDYQADYEALRTDVETLATELVVAYLRATYAKGQAIPALQAGPLAWLALLGHMIGDLEDALMYIARYPTWETERAVVEGRLEQARRPDTMLRRAIRHGAGRGAKQIVADGYPARERVPSIRGRYTLDTPSHRWLAAQVQYIQRRLATLHQREARQRLSVRRHQTLKDLQALQNRMTRLSQLPPMQVRNMNRPVSPPLRLFTAPGYREAYRICVRLRQGLNLEGGPLQLGQQALHLLYEYWCYLTLVKLIARHTGHPLPWATLLAVEQQGLHLRLAKGRTHALSFDLSDGRKLSLVYSPRFTGKHYLVPQQPDMLLTLHDEGAQTAQFILDAKYRVDASLSYQRRYGMPGPPADALNTLHRYRDAIQGEVVQALALFPFHGQADVFAESRHHRLLGQIGVGAIPLLPGHTAFLEDWLRTILGLDAST